MNIIFIGFMGVGKGTIAREFSKRSGLMTIDTDDLIESLENAKIKDIFAEKGEDYFRNLEKDVASWLEKSVDNTIISTGGGFLNQPNLHKIGTVIYLKSSFEAIVNKIFSHPNAKKKIKKRPLLKDLNEAKKLYEKRVTEYKNVADYSLNVKYRELDDIVDELDYLLKGLI